MLQGTEFRPTINKLLNEIESTDELSTFRLNVLKKTIFKKYLGTAQQSASLEDAALDDFIERNDELAKFTRSALTDDLIRYIKDEFQILLGFRWGEPDLNLYNFMNNGYCGPGASVGTKNTDFLNKMFCSPLATTSYYLYSVYRDNLSERWLLAEDLRLKHHSLLQVVGSKISTVPKDESKRRVICSEPVLNMFFQLGAKTLIEDRLRIHHNIDVTKQPEINKSLARVGSIDRSLSTIDLKDASDSITTTLIQQVLPPEVFSVLDKIRSRNASVKGKFVELNMFSTMGNGFTFPLMTSLFSCLVRAVYRMNNVHPRAGINYSIFGDDIICIDSLYDKIISALVSLGFLPNIHKSFSEGFFRESCGGDYLHGFNVRGVYIKELDIERPETIYSSINSLLHWSVASGIDVSSIVGYLLLHVPIRFVSQWSSFDSGIVCPRDIVDFYPRDKNGSIRFKRLEPIARKYRVFDDHPNPYGAVICFIGGYVREQSVTSRARHVRYALKKRVCPTWLNPVRPFPLLQLKTFKANLESFKVVAIDTSVLDRREVLQQSISHDIEYAVSLRLSLEFRSLCMLDPAVL